MIKDRIVTVTEAARRFSDLVNRVFYRGETATLVRGGVPVARLTPPVPSTCSARDLARRWEHLPHLAPDDAAAFASELEEGRRALPPAVARWG